MKKIWIVAVLGVLALLVVGGVGVAFAQSVAPLAPFNQWGASMMGANGFARGGMMRGWAASSWDRGDAPLHEYMVQAVAEVFGLSVEEVEALHDEGITLWEWAQEQGMSLEEFQSKMLEAKQIALDAAVADGVITQEQADWMLSHMFGMWGAGGFGPCHGYGNFGGRGRGFGGRGYQAPAAPDA